MGRCKPICTGKQYLTLLLCLSELPIFAFTQKLTTISPWLTVIVTIRERIYHTIHLGTVSPVTFHIDIEAGNRRSSDTLLRLTNLAAVVCILQTIVNDWKLQSDGPYPGYFTKLIRIGYICTSRNWRNCVSGELTRPTSGLLRGSHTGYIKPVLLHGFQHRERTLQDHTPRD